MRKKIIVLGLITVLMFTGCQKAPENSIVKKKSFDNMIKKAQDESNGSKDVAGVADNYTIYENEFSDEKLGVSVKANAKVEIPATDKLSVYRVKQKKISQNFIDKVVNALGIENQMYDGSMLDVKTKDDIAKEIQRLKKEMKSLSSSDEDKITKKEDELSIKQYEKEYKNAPESVNMDEYKMDIKLNKVDDLVKKYNNSEFYEWVASHNKGGEYMYCIGEANDGSKKSIYVQNNKNYGNCFRYFSSRNVYGFIKSAAIGDYLDTNLGMWPADEKPSMENLRLVGEEEDYYDNIFKYEKEYKNEKTTISADRAQQIADDFLNKIDLKDFTCSKNQLVYEMIDSEVTEYDRGARKVYFLRYLRQVDNVQVNNESGTKFADSGSGDNYQKFMWPGESIDFIINDDGIVTFNYNTPIEITKTVVEKSNLKKFDEIKDTFEQMITTTNSVENSEEKIDMNVNEVVLRYMRISEENSFDTGLLVPVWEFLGTKESNYEKSDSSEEKNLLTINGIDGTVIDVQLGY